MSSSCPAITLEGLLNMSASSPTSLSDSQSRSRPRPLPNLRSSAVLESENIAPMDEDNQTFLSASSECQLRRAGEMPHPRPARSQSMSDGLGQRTFRQSEDAIPLKLPTIPNQSYKSITGDQLAELLRSSGLNSLYDRILILDARFAYEYDGGHIRGAENVFTPIQQESIKEKLLKYDMGDRLCVVIHCEFSSHRGPRLFQLLRSFDRERNDYPALSFPEMYLLHGGYKDFFAKFPDLCSLGYVPMHDSDYKKLCSAALRLTRSQSSTKIKSLSRSTSDVSRMLSPIGGREEGMRNGETSEMSRDFAFLSEPIPRRVIISSGGHSDSVFATTFFSQESLTTTEGTLDTCSSDTEDEEDENDLFHASPAAARFRSRVGPASRSSAPPRSATFHSIPFRQNFTRSTSDLYLLPEEDVEFAGPFTSRS